MLPLDIPLSALLDLYYDCPSNLKEAIDWILRVTGKDTANGESKAPYLEKAVEKLLDGVQSSSPELGSKLDAIKVALKTQSNNGIIDALDNGLAKFKEGIHQTKRPQNNVYKELNSHPNLTSEVPKAGEIFLGCVPLCFYGLSYLYWRCDKGGWSDLNFSGNGSQSSAYVNKSDLKDFMISVGFGSKVLNDRKQGSQIFQDATQKFQDFQQGMSKAKGVATERAGKESKVIAEFNLTRSGYPTDDNPTYPEFLKTLNEEASNNINGNITNHASTHPLSTLFQISRLYFAAKQTAIYKLPEYKPRPPFTIREMLYFLAALPFSPLYDSLNEHISSLFKDISPKSSNDDAELLLPVAISGSQNKGDYLNPDEIRDYITNTCFFSSVVLGVIQGHSADSRKNGEPWLHSLFSNSQFKLSIPSSGAGIFGALSNYAYALQFQLHFLYQQCSNVANTCGWRECQFGKAITPNGSMNSTDSVKSHICPALKCQDAQCKHANGGGCNHNNYEQTGGCGQKYFSPLQAFLTDCIDGMCRQHPVRSYQLATCSGYMCHVPMDFNPNDLRSEPKNGAQGENICLTLRPFCGGFNTPLRQLSEKLGCLTKRTPRTLGDLFGFTWHLNGQLFNSNGSGTVDESLVKFFQSLGVSDSNWGTISTLNPSTFWGKVQEKIASLNPPSQTRSGIEKSLTVFSGLPFLYQLFMVKPDDSLPAVLFKIKSIPHQISKPPQYSGEHDDLYSLFNSTCSETNCGPYLYPLTHSDGATYNPAHASTYLSWVLYLSDDLQSWFQDMLDEFKNIDCKASGCVKCKEGTHKLGEHGEESKCQCPSVVQCGGTLPLLYRHGFRYFNPAVLMGGSSGTGIRKCSAFAQQLQTVVNGNPLTNLLTTIDDFLYAIRWEFFSKLSGFWTIYLTLILYTFFFLLDTLRVRSHLHFPSSNSIAPISLLGTGKAPALTKFTKLTYFTTDLT
ncbi:variant erythrocyte surface antigen-1 family protein [Babesia caballi]|uniref:Variant erythrocyte surface antigen-1 family protein n=1 Tax=Babesia caballi TaxID=5871 RepID=A0AAV4LSX0_BABCB|nr:variant erythrocyte surface antigen-1 family protein [Babesia caballi]